MRIKWFNRRVYEVPPLSYNDPVIVLVDPSKTNMAICVFSIYGDPLSVVELSGNNWSSGPIDDTSIFCQEFKVFLTAYLSRVNVVYFGIEKAITKKGMMHHHSNMTLTEIRGQLIDWCIVHLGEKPDEINNWSWKHAILPEGYRSQSVKMSKRFLVDVMGFTEFESYYEEDVTDVFCMALYILQTKFANITRRVTSKEEPKRAYLCYIKQKASPVRMDELAYTPGYTFSDHVAFGVNHLSNFRFTFPISELALHEIYDFSRIQEEPVDDLIVVEVLV